MKLNLGCCDLPLKGWVNIDNSTSPHIKADLVANALDLSEHFQLESVDEIYAGHLIEHLMPDEVELAVIHWKSLLKPGGKLAIMTPDFHHLCEQYLTGAITIEEMTDLYVFSYSQESEHRSLWDQESLFKLFARHGFKDIKPIDRMKNEYSPYGVEWQCGVEGLK
jgi:predicted SAM-dependent methyltransferase